LPVSSEISCRKRAIEQALDDELKSAVELLAQEKMKQGLSHPEARRQAVIELGGRRAS